MLATSVEELTRQNQEMRLWLQQEDNRSKTNRDDYGDNQRRDDHWRLVTPKGASLDLLREMRKEIGKLRNVIKEKIDRSLDRMVRRKNSPFTTVVLKCPVPSKFRLPQLEPFDGLKDPLNHLNTFKTASGL